MLNLLEQHRRLRAALEDLVGASDPESLKQMRGHLDALMPKGDPDRTPLFAAIDALLEIPNA